MHEHERFAIWTRLAHAQVEEAAQADVCARITQQLLGGLGHLQGRGKQEARTTEAQHCVPRLGRMGTSSKSKRLNLIWCVSPSRFLGGRIA